MRDDLPAAALRLLSALPVRTHEQRFPTNQKVGLKPGQAPAHKQAGNRSRPAANPGAGRGGANRKRVIVDGREYASIGEARKAMRCSIFTLYAMLANGGARYVSEADQRQVNLGRAHGRNGARHHGAKEHE